MLQLEKTFKEITPTPLLRELRELRPRKGTQSQTLTEFGADRINIQALVPCPWAPAAGAAEVGVFAFSRLIPSLTLKYTYWQNRPPPLHHAAAQAGPPGQASREQGFFTKAWFTPEGTLQVTRSQLPTELSCRQRGCCGRCCNAPYWPNWLSQAWPPSPFQILAWPPEV